MHNSFRIFLGCNDGCHSMIRLSVLIMNLYYISFDCSNGFIFHITVFVFQMGTIKEIRLIRRPGGKSKGYAYVEFESEVGMLF